MNKISLTDWEVWNHNTPEAIFEETTTSVSTSLASNVALAVSTLLCSDWLEVAGTQYMVHDTPASIGNTLPCCPHHCRGLNPLVAWGHGIEMYLATSSSAIFSGSSSGRVSSFPTSFPRNSAKGSTMHCFLDGGHSTCRVLVCLLDRFGRSCLRSPECL